MLYWEGGLEEGVGGWWVEKEGREVGEGGEEGGGEGKGRKEVGLTNVAPKCVSYILSCLPSLCQSKK